MKRSPNDTDRHAGSRLRMRRTLVGMSQEKLGEALGLTFQQVQKYEKGTNRMGASRLQQIGQVLGVAPSYFFEGLPGSDTATGLGFAEDGSAGLISFVSSSEGMALNKAFPRIKDARVRRKIIDLVVALAEDDALPSQE